MSGLSIALSCPMPKKCSQIVTDNFVEDILEDFKFEVAPPYVLYRSKTEEVWCLCNTDVTSTSIAGKA